MNILSCVYTLREYRFAPSCIPRLASRSDRFIQCIIYNLTTHLLRSSILTDVPLGSRRGDTFRLCPIACVCNNDVPPVHVSPASSQSRRGLPSSIADSLACASVPQGASQQDRYPVSASCHPCPLSRDPVTEPQYPSQSSIPSPTHFPPSYASPSPSKPASLALLST